jgi:hypothetical protein
MTFSEGRSRGALVGSLLLLGASFVLLVLAPQILARFQSASETMPSGGFLPIAAASGIALGGGAAMIAVMARLVRDIEVRPYACLAPVLAVFTGYVMWGLRAKLPLENVSTEYAGVFALAVSVAGGSLVAQRSGGARMIGWGLALFAPLALLGLLWASSGQVNLGTVVSSLTPQVKMYLGLLGGTALAMAVLGEGSRVLSRRAAADRLVVPGSTQNYGYQNGHIEDERLFDPPLNRLEQEPPRYEPPPMRFDIKPTRAPRVNVWEFEDDDVAVPKRGFPWLTTLLILALAGGAGGAFYYGVYMPKQQKEQAALQVLQERQQQLKASQAQEEAQKRSQESQAAATRLQAILGGSAPAAGAKAAGAPAAEPAAAPAAKAAAPADKSALTPSASAPKQNATPTAVQAAPGRAAVPAKRPEAARKAVQQDKPAAPAKTRDDGESNSDPIYGL